MNKKIISILSLMVLSGTLCAAASAADLTAELEMDGNLMHVYGSLNSAESNEVLMRVIRYTENAVDADNDIVYIEQKTSNDDGSFDFYCELKESESSGDDEFTPSKYIYSVGALNGSEDFRSDIIEYYGSGYQKNVLKELNAAKSDIRNNNDTDAATKKIKAALADAEDKLHMGAAIYNQYMLSAENYDEFAVYFAGLPDLELDNGLTELRRQINETAAVIMIRNSKNDSENLIKLLESENIRTSLGIQDSTALKTYEEFKDICGSEMASSYAASTFGGTAESKSAYEMAVIATALKESLTSAQVKSVLDTNKVILNIDNSKYTLTDQEYLKLSGVKITALTDVKNKIEQIISNRNSNSGTNSNRGNGGGGSSGGSGGKQEGIIPVQPQKPDSNESRIEFTDLDGYAWAEESIKMLSEQGIISGRSSDVFAPGDNVTREEFLKMLLAGLEITSDKNTTIVFEDVREDSWYSDYVKAAYANGIVTGISENRFGIGISIKREDAAVMAYRALQNLNLIDDSIQYTSDFNDAQNISEYTYQAVSAMLQLGVISGYDDGNFLPQNSITRAESAVIIKRLIDAVIM